MGACSVREAVTPGPSECHAVIYVKSDASLWGNGAAPLLYRLPREVHSICGEFTLVRSQFGQVGDRGDRRQALLT